MVFGRHFTKYYFKYGVYFILGIAALVLVDYFQLIIPEVVGDIVDGIKYETLTKAALSNFAIELLGVAIVVFFGRFVWRICIFGNGVRIETDIRNDMFAHMEKLSVTYFSTHKTGALMALYTNDLSTIRQSFASGTLMLIDALSLGILAFIKMYKLNQHLLLICIVPLVLISVFAGLMRKRISRKVKKNLEAFSNMSDYVQEDFSGISVIKAFVKENRRKFLFNIHNKANMDTAIDFVKEQSIIQVIINGILTIVTLSIIFTGGYFIYQIQTGNTIFDITIGQLITFNSYFGSLIWPVMAIGDLINLRGQSKASEKRVSELLDEKVEINDLLAQSNELQSNKLQSNELQVEDFRGDIKFNDLTFTYPNSSNPVLKNITFNIHAGEMIGIMGSTGCGKTSIVELLLRLYNIEENKIFLDDQDIMKLPLKLVRDLVAYVPQETFLFKQTIDENIAFAYNFIDKEKTHEAAINASVASDIELFKDGYDTILGERGVTVSGGQKQRIAIARALIKDSPILILDDSLSAVDTITESYILEKLRKLRKNKTTIIIAHRITTLETLDRIIVVNDGSISDIGTHEYLYNNNEIYQKEVHLQELEKELEVNE